MYSYNDFECLFVRYKLEGIPAGVSIEKFCLSNKVPYNLFAKWYKDTRKKIIPVQVLGALSSEAENEGNSFLNSGTKSRSGYSAFFEYRTSSLGGYPHEQWCSYQSEKLKLRDSYESDQLVGERFHSFLWAGYLS